MNQQILLFTAIALVFGAFAFGSQGETSNVVWIMFFGSAAVAYSFWRNRGEVQTSSAGQEPTSTDSDGRDAAATLDAGVAYGSTSNESDRQVV